MFASRFWYSRVDLRAVLVALTMAVLPMVAACGGPDGGAAGPPSVAPGGPPSNAPGQTPVEATIGTLCSRAITGCPGALIGWTVEKCKDEVQTCVGRWSAADQRTWSEWLNGQCLTYSDGCVVLRCWGAGRTAGC